MTFYESMSVLKKRLFKNESKDLYYKAVINLATYGWGGKIQIEVVDLNSMEIFKEVSNLSIENNLDVADAIQIYAILKGKYSQWIQESASVLITADERQEQAAKTYGIRVWNCLKEVKPKWLNN